MTSGRRPSADEPADVVAALPVGVLLLGRDWTVRMVNDTARLAMGAVPVVGSDLRAVLPDGADSPLGMMLRDVYADGRERSLSVPGADRGSASRVTGRRFDDGLLVVLQSADGERYRTLFDALHEGVTILYLDGDPLSRDAYEYVNDKVYEILGMDAKGRAPENLPRMLRPDGSDMPGEELPVAMVARTGKPVSLASLLIERPDGRRRWLRVSARPATVDGRPAVVSTIHDDTEHHLAQAALHESEVRLRAVLDASAEGIMLVDRDNRPTVINAAARRILDLGPGQPSGASALFEGRRAIRLDGSAADLADTGERVRMEGISVSSRISGLVDRDGATQWMSTDLAPLPSSTTAPHPYVVTFRDITRAVERGRALADSEQRFRTVFDRASIGMGILTCDGQIEKANRAWAEMLDHRLSELEGRSLADITYPGEDALLTDEDLARLRDGESIRRHTRYARADGQPIWVQADHNAVLDEHGQVTMLLIQVQDIDDQHRHEEELAYLADHDALTGLLNRRGFQHALQRHVETTRRYGADGALLMLDLDDLKHVNDTLGHQAGDALIVATGRTLSDRLRESDVVARLGGDEFAILLPTGREQEAVALAEALLEALRTELVAAGACDLVGPRGASASIGIAICRNCEDGEELLADADLAMYDAKERGRGRWALHSATDHSGPTSMRARFSWMSRIQTALDERAFELWAQPIVDLQADQTSLLEVLLRMRGPDGEVIPPGEFLPAAERGHLIHEIDGLVLDHAIQALAGAPERLALSVNVSARTLAETDVLRHVTTLLRRNGVAPSRLVVEITETSAVEDVEAIVDFADGLESLGGRLAIDDFGAGYGAFSYLRHLKFDFLKIDGTFVAGALTNPTDRLIVQAVRHLAHGLGRAVIAEHCSKPVLEELLRTEGIDYAQGYHFGRPAPLSSMIEALA